MTEKPEQIKKHIANLREFEQKYGEFIAALEADWFAGQAQGAIGAPDDLGSGWSGDEFKRRKRKIAMLAAKADRAMKASGVGQIVLGHPPAIGGGVKAADLPSQVFEFVEMGYEDDGLSFQRSILERIPAQLAGLQMKLEEAELALDEATKRGFGGAILDGLSEQRERRAERRAASRQKRSSDGSKGRPWHEHPWVVATGATVIGGLILAAILAVLGLLPPLTDVKGSF